MQGAKIVAGATDSLLPGPCTDPRADAGRVQPLVVGDACRAAIAYPVLPQAAAVVARLRAPTSPTFSSAATPAAHRAEEDAWIFASCGGVTTAVPDQLIETGIDGGAIPDIVVERPAIT